MEAHLLLPHTLRLPHPNLHVFTKRSLPRTKSLPPLTFILKTSRQLYPLRHRRNRIYMGVRFEGPVMDVAELSEIEDGEVVVETCITRTLPPALTLEQGLVSIKEAVEKLKLDPPCSTSGVFRFQVAVPPSAKALNWFCCQPETSEVFPLFFLSKDKDNPTIKSLYLNETRGVFGIGAAISFASSSSCILDEHSSIKRYLTNDSIPLMTVGFKDIQVELSSMKHEAGQSYFFIPQVELNEYEGLSILAATLAWRESSPYTFEEAVCSLTSTLYQVSVNYLPSTGKCYSGFLRSSLRAFNVVDDESLRMVYTEVPSGAGGDFRADIMEMKEVPSSCQFCFRLSPTVAVVRKMNKLGEDCLGYLTLSTQLDYDSQIHYLERDCANINAVWASLIVEECFRLGLTYFCIAPGSRSSPLAVAASSHPLVSCVVCFDERSLAFHAVGYARGSHNPAVVITTSGTAVSNLLPAVVEASQDFVPLLLLTADRPPELQDVGANQAINQENHFGSFVRYFFSLPAPNDQLPARMVLTTLDSAVHWATSSPSGPVHVNCPFREPLENCSSQWTFRCLKGLDFWRSGTEPFTKYIQLRQSQICRDTYGQVAEVLKIIQGAKKGLLLIGAIQVEDEIWAAMLLAKHIFWPVVADILSGLRMRKISTSFPDVEPNFLYVDHLDHALLSESVGEWLEFDVIIQIGSRITSKRISKMLEKCSPCSYIMIDKHPSRHDPSHIVTHRIQSSIIGFVNCLLESKFPCERSRQGAFLQAMNMTVSWEIRFQTCANCSLTEPQVAQVISEALPNNSALFFGNSMPIRDADMYASSWSKYDENVAATMSILGPLFHWTRVAGNRGASGIDGLLSTAIGYAVGCNKRVICVIGDVSFLHDTNGLAILNQRMLRRPVTILVINNHGGAIFSLLPIAETTEQHILDQYFFTSHNISIRSLCMAHGLKHLRAQTKVELQDALFSSQQEEMDHIIEVESSIELNATFHSLLRTFACQSIQHSFNILSSLAFQDSISSGIYLCKICRMEYSLFRLPLCARPTSASANQDRPKFYRDGFILSLFLEDGSVGLGEVAPLEIHTENMLEVEEQLKCLLHILGGAKISIFLPLLKGSFSSWMWHELGIPPSSIFPSVRCGLEMAILNAVAMRQGSSLLKILHPNIDDQDNSRNSSNVLICALIDSNGSPSEVAYVAKSLVEEGFAAIKLKVARQGNVIYNAAVVQEVRKLVGHLVELRVDANRIWSYEEAMGFGSLVKDCGLQYIEEPVIDEEDIVRFCEQSGLPVALDETVDRLQGNPLEALAKYSHPGIVAVVIKPSMVGGFENAALLAKWAQQKGKMAVISATFESGIGLSAYIQFSCYIELQNAETCKLMNRPFSPIAHGLGTYRWLEEDVTTSYPLRISCNPHNGFVEASATEANHLLQRFLINDKIITRSFSGEQVQRYQLTVDSNDLSYLIEVQEIGQRTNDDVFVFLHGFLGTGEDWISIMKAMSGHARCISVDLPGHGGSKLQKNGVNSASQVSSLSIDVIADILNKLIHHIAPGKVHVVGYSMGARITLYMALRFEDKIQSAILISGSPGLKDEGARRLRRAKDDSRARSLVDYGLETFMDMWYAGDLWKSLRGHPHFSRIVSSRLKHNDLQDLAKVLSDSSTGRQTPLWEDLKHCRTSLLLIVGEKDMKFKMIAQKMLSDLNYASKNKSKPMDEIHEMVEIPNSGHAVHLENPLAVISALSKFLIRLKINPNEPQ